MEENKKRKEGGRDERSNGRNLPKTLLLETEKKEKKLFIERYAPNLGAQNGAFGVAKNIKQDKQSKTPPFEM